MLNGIKDKVNSVTSSIKSVKKIWSNEYSDFKKKSLNWRTMISLSFNKDVLKCPNCQNIMIYYKSEYP